MRKFSKKTVAVAGSAAFVVAAAGVAYAYYATSIVGSGTGTATPAVNAASPLTFASSAITGLVPGGSAVSTTVTFTNPNAYAVSFPARTVSVASVSGPAGCATNAVALLSGTANLTAGVLPANGSTTITVPVAMADSITVDQTACAGAALTVTYAAA
ncbi:MAG TPA: hypothetical protein VGX28_16090 [Frankiaceae bacterium]|jgi:hypothetical protein|nr:hypothetical protein [Frankiaceae bacterium]